MPKTCTTKHIAMFDTCEALMRQLFLGSTIHLGWSTLSFRVTVTVQTATQTLWIWNRKYANKSLALHLCYVAEP